MERKELLERLENMAEFPDKYGITSEFAAALADLMEDIEEARKIDQSIDDGKYVGLEAIVQERIRQYMPRLTGGEGFTLASDSRYVNAELLRAAIRYAAVALPQQFIDSATGSPLHPWGTALSEAWPWDKEWWKPSKDPIRNLAKAGALIGAEMDRIANLSRARVDDLDVEIAPRPDPILQEDEEPTEIDIYCKVDDDGKIEPITEFEARGYYVIRYLPNRLDQFVGELDIVIRNDDNRGFRTFGSDEGLSDPGKETLWPYEVLLRIPSPEGFMALTKWRINRLMQNPLLKMVE